MPVPKVTSRSPWAWVPSLYLVEGLPYALVMTVATIMYKGLGISNAQIAFYTSWLYLPWVIKPLWSPVVDLLKTRRSWIWVMQVVVGGACAAIALTLPATRVFQYSLAAFWLLAFSSATQDIAIDGFYLLATTEKEQAFFVGIRNTFYRISAILGQGLLVTFAGAVQKNTGDVRFAWEITFFLLAAIFLGFAIYHRFILPHPPADQPGVVDPETPFLEKFLRTFGSFLSKDKIGLLLSFLLLYRFAEAQLAKMVVPFLLDTRDVGGLGLTTEQVGLAYGTVGIGALVVGGLLGGMVASRNGLKYWLWWMVLAIHLPDAIFVYLAYAQPVDFLTINLCVAMEQFGYGFGFTAYLLYMLHIARGAQATAHYAICTGFMALGMMIPQMWSGWLQQQLGYPHFFVWVLLATIPAILVVKFIPLDTEFGKRTMPMKGA